MLGPLNYFLGIQVHRDQSTMDLTQQKYVQDLLAGTNMLDSKVAATPRMFCQTLSQNDGEPLPNPTEYRSIVGVLQYLTLTRPDISFAVNKACQFMATPTMVHWLAVKRILRYLKCRSSFGIHLHQAPSLSLHGYIDADWASFPDDRRSTTGCGVFLGPKLVSWSSTKQKVVSRSNTESEYHSLAAITSEIIWIQYLLQELCIA